MTYSLVDYWSNVPGDTRIHPGDRRVFKQYSEHYHFDLRCLPNQFLGPLSSARLVLLFLSPGLDTEDIFHADTKEGQSYYQKQRSGVEPLPLEFDHASAFRWWSRILKQLTPQDPEALRQSVAILNLSAYKSKTFDDPFMLSALPSSRFALSWAQEVLFPEAVAGGRMVLCLRANERWGLPKQKRGLVRIGEALYSVDGGRGGFSPLDCRESLETQAAKYLA